MQETINTQATRAEINRILETIPGKLVSGDRSTSTLLTHVGQALLKQIRKSFVAKMRGGADEVGDRWAPLSPKTIAYGRRGLRNKRERARESRPSQALTKKQQDLWWEYYRRGLARYAGDKGRAAAVAWVILKGMGAVTLLQKYGNRKVDILRDTGKLLSSLSPGEPSEHSVFRVGRGDVTVGTNRPGALAHHEGDPPRLPQRRLWPEPERWSTGWWRGILVPVRDGVVKMVMDELRGTT